MSDTQASAPAPAAAAPAPSLPPMAAQAVSLLGRHALTWLGGLLLAHGVFATTGDVQTFVEIGLAVLTPLAGVGLGLAQAWLARLTLVAAVNAPPPATPLPAPKLPFFPPAGSSGQTPAK